MWNRFDQHRPFLTVLAVLFAAATSVVASPPRGALPLSFVPNRGQSDSAVRFEVRGQGGHLFFTPGEVVFSLPSNVLRLRFVGASRHAEVVAGGLLPGIFNSFTGNDPSRWRRGLPTYDGVVYRGLYPGVDLAYEGREGMLKGTYTLAPGIDPGRVRWRYEGASELSVDEVTGDLRIVLPGGAPLVENAPVAWQELDGARREVDVRFVLLDGGTVGFRVGRHDAKAPLVIDPALLYSTYLGGSDTDQATGLAVDPAGAVYLTGQTLSSSFPLVSPLQTSFGVCEAFVSKLDPTTNALIYSTFLGGSGTDVGVAIFVENGEAYVTGETDSPDFPVTGPPQSSLGGGVFDAFVVQLDTSGGLALSSYLGGSSWDAGTTIGYDPVLHEIVVAGHTDSSDFPVVNAWQPALAGAWDFFLTRIDPSGAVVVSTYFGGEGLENDPDLAIDARGLVHLVGSTSSPVLPVVSGGPQPIYGGGFSDAILVVFEDDLAPLYGTYLGGSDNDYGHAVAVDGQGGTVVVGSTRSPDFPVVGQPWQPWLLGAEDAFVARFDPAGSPVHVTFLGGSAEDGALDVAVDPYDFAYVTGGTSSPDFPLAGPWQGALLGSTDAFVAAFDAAGTSLLFSTFLGGSGEDWGAAVAAQAGDLAYVAGFTNSYDFPTVTPWQPNQQGGDDAFLSVLHTEASRCRELVAPGEIPTPSVLDFDNFSGPTNVLGTFYLASHGVSFEDSSVTKARDVVSSTAASPPREATNNAVAPYTSENVPMRIDFSGAKTHVGMWMGNGESEHPTAVLTAFDAAGNVLCQSVRPGVPEPDTLFAGLHDPRGRIRKVTLDYGFTLLNETIDDLTFTP